MKPTEARLDLKHFYRAPRETVYQAWTRPELIKQWFAPGDMTTPFAEVDLRVGGRYRIQMKKPDGETHTTTGLYKEIVPNQRLVFTWGWEGPDRFETLVTVEFRETDGGTELLLTHERFTDTGSRDMHREGWEGCLASLERRLAKA